MSQSAFVHRADGIWQVHTGKVELGQGLHTALAQIAADALGVSTAQLQLMPVDTATSPDQGVTSGSQSIQQAGAALREAAAQVLATTQGRSQTPAASGQSLPRTELAGLFAGQAHFIHDLQWPGMLHGRVVHPPSPGRTLEQVNEQALQGLDWHRDGRLFGVLAPSNAQAQAAGLRLLSALTWGEASEQDLLDEHPQALMAMPANTRVVLDTARQEQRASALAVHAKADRERSLSACYTKPWIAHASIAPSCALAQWSETRAASSPTGQPGVADSSGVALRVWTHSQGIFNLRRDMALAFGLQEAQVRVTHVPGAGCYGHNGADDVAFDAAWLARHAQGRPVRVVWSRQDELSLSPQGPAMAMKLEATLEAQGQISRWQHEVFSPGHSRRPGRSATPALLGAWEIERAFEAPASIDMPLANGGGAERNAIPGYAIASQRVLVHSVHTQRRSSALRGLGAFGNVFAAECFMDELAQAAGQDPLAFRLRHLQHDVRALAVLQAAAAQAGWGQRPPPAKRPEGQGFGLAQARYKNTGAWCAVVAQVLAGESVQVQRLTIAVDVGHAVNPDGVRAQVEGGAIQATSWALLESAKRSHAGWSDYAILRFSQVPKVDVILIPSHEPSLGAGEASLGPTVAAIGNALFDALGVRVRALPFTPERITEAINQG